MRKSCIILLLLNICVFAYSQNTITGTFSGLTNQQVKLVGFTGFDTYTIDSVETNEKGAFNLSYRKQDIGMGYLLAEDGNSFVVILEDNENIELEGKSPAFPKSIVILNGKQNRFFDQYASEHSQREQTLSAWGYLEKIYKSDTLFSVQKRPKKAIEKEKQRIKAEDSLFLANLPEGSYASWYLPVRKLISSVSTIAQYRPEEIPPTIDAFRKLDYTDNRLYKSGLLKETIESHFWLIENSGRSLDSVYIDMSKSIDILTENLLTDEQKLNEISEYLFKLLEKRSLFKASEYLAVTLLNEISCTIHDDFAAQLESYRAMKIGKTAPDIAFNDAVFAPGHEPDNIPKRLSDIKNDFVVVIFGASWCPACPSELAQIARVYNKWKSQNVEVVFVSLDEKKELFEKFVAPFPFISICDYQKWESPPVKEYHVFATPTIYLLDNKREILLRPKSVNQMDSWVDWHLVKGNK
ncbi:TlpA disulfide reductase family protein [uncultured Marixanthomonas sp.]|mgnify:CR=1 FL=1|uniref:TlpA disulfide reductase family protein n=1 Tax=uncultured Marixanthomonas sp. TaxID=757245 RepID=UPI0030DBD649|tara:strand:- start:9104 stop:10504 length:1401 start_codon:yes stop_codon:yes gene_type:complete